ncbi:hypothetical protein B0H34DRAFT_755565 [Crassisporium funariophilum]|nr:hypothetical protein B0H34DRAFT_755565 [Crassisporium funariophilum]
MHCSIDPYPGRVAWLKIWWCNRNTHLINGYYISAGRKVGGGYYASLILAYRLVFRWLAIPWLQAELDLWTSRYNSSPRRADKHKILPHGIPDLIHAKPHQFNGSKNFMVVISPELFDEVEKEWAPPDDPVFQLVPPTFGEQASALYASIGSPSVSSLTFWAVYSDLLDAFLALPHDPAFAAALLMADQGEEHDVPIMVGILELRHGDNVVGPYGYVYMGGLDNPVLPAGLVDGGDDGSEDTSKVDLQEYADFKTSQYAADFTGADNTAVVHCARESCQATFLAGTKLHFLHSNNPNEPGRMLCLGCYQYYMQKKTTVHRTSMAVPRADHQKEIHRQISSAQRGPITNVVQAVGPTAYVPSFQAGYVIGTSNGPMRVAAPPGPSVQLPGFVPQFSMGQISAGHSGPQKGSGYTGNHAAYHVTRQSLAQKAYATQSLAQKAFSTNGGNVVTVKVRAVHKPVGGVRFLLVGDIVEAVNNIPVHIGAAELKKILYDEILPSWQEYTEGFPINIDGFVMRDKDGARIKPNVPDRDVISKPFFKTARGGQVFKEGRCIVNFHVPNPIYSQYLIWSERREEQRLHAEATKQSERQVVITPTQNQGKKQGKKRYRSPSLEPESDAFQTHHTSGVLLDTRRNLVFDTPQTPETPGRSSKRLKAGPSYDLSPTTRRLGDALCSQHLPTAKDVQSLFDLKTIRVTIYPVKHHTLSQLLDMCSGTNSQVDHKAYLGPPGEATLQLELSSKKQKKGGFKLSSFGTASRALFGQSRDVCAKQTYYEKSGTVKSKGKEIQVTQNIPHDGRTQAQNLTMEIACLVWARVLLDLVYAFIEKGIQAKGERPPFHIPQLRFVDAALAVEHANSGKESQVFLLEQVIGGEGEGAFWKYMNNVSPVPLPLSDKEDQEHALFLAFSQHVQYFKTRKLVFVSDYQGGNSLLSDPQIITDSALGVIFADGNHPSGHTNLEPNHRCNYFCKWFEVPTDYDLWESQGSVLRPAQPSPKSS